MRTKHCCVSAVALLGTLALSGSALAADWIIKDTSPQDRPMRLDVVGHVDPFGVFNAGVGTWLVIPVVPDGFIPSLNDQFNVEAGFALDYYEYDHSLFEQSWLALTPMAGVRYDMHLTPSWTAFVKAKGGWVLTFNEELDGGDLNDFTRFAFEGGVGVYYHFSDNLALRLETGSFSLVSAGLSFAF